ncbi:hypothetical protein DFQ30_003677 [Apophysomyces sp. BC1015]|nr:hypothetical protein DFQ30_003677 [Apophysomyces sp. BC1015]
MSVENAQLPYVHSFLTKRPKEGLDIVQNRLKQAKILDEELVQYFRESQFTPIWKLLYDEFTEISTAHAVLAFKITEEIVKPLKSTASQEYDKIKDSEATFQRIAKEYDVAKKGDRSSVFKRVGAAKHSAENPAATWYKNGPGLLESYQAVDEARWDRLKSLVEKFEQCRVEQMTKCIEVATTTISAATAFDTKQEINYFCSHHGEKLAKHSPLTPEADSLYRNSALNETSTSLRSAGVRVKSLLRRKPKNDMPSKLTESSFAHIDEEPPTHSEVPEPGGSNILPGTPQISNDNTHQGTPSKTPSSDTGSQNKSLADVHSGNSFNGSATNKPFDNAFRSESPVLDGEGYSVPPPDRSFISNAMEKFTDEPDELDFDPYGSQRLKFDIKANAVHNEEDNQEAKATLTRMASLLRENSPTVSRRSRGRRENTRSTTADSTISTGRSSLNAFSNNSEIVRKGSNMSLGSTSDIASSNPFRQSSFDVSTPTSMNTMSSLSSRSPSLAYESPWQLHPIAESSQPQIYATIKETVDMLTEAASQKSVLASGQIKLAYNGPVPAMNPLLIRLKSTDQFENITPNPVYIEALQDQTDVYALKAGMFESNRGMPVPCFSYQLRLGSDSLDVLPLRLSPSWKCTEEQSLLMVKYQTSPAFEPRKGQVVVCAKFDQVPVLGVQSTPQAVWDASKCQLTWTTEVLVDQQQSLQTEGAGQRPPRLLAKFLTQQQGSPQAVMLKYYCRDALASNISVEAVPAFGSMLDVKQVHTLVKSGNLSFL